LTLKERQQRTLRAMHIDPMTEGRDRAVVRILATLLRPNTRMAVVAGFDVAGRGCGEGEGRKAAAVCRRRR
jgi:hypothetical protein